MKEFKAISDILNITQEQIHQKKFQKQLVKKLFHKLHSKKLKLASVIDKYFELTNKIIQSDEIIRNDFSFFQKYLRLVIKSFARKQTHLKNLEPALTNLNNQIKILENKFENLIHNFNYQKTHFKLLEKYLLIITSYITVVNEGPVINSILKYQLPHELDTIKKSFKIAQDRSVKTLSFANFQIVINKIRELFQETQKNFHLLNFPVAKKGIVKIWECLHYLKNWINNEIQAMQIIEENYLELVHEVQNVFKHFKHVQLQYKNWVGSGNEISMQFEKSHLNLQNECSQVKELLNDLQKIMEDSNLSFSKKIVRVNSFAEKIFELINSINEFAELFRVFCLENILLRNQLARAQHTLEEIIVITQKNNIKLSVNELKQLGKLNNKSFIVEEQIKGTITKMVEEQIKEFLQKFTHFYKLVTIKIELALHSKNMLSELAIIRAQSPALNFALIIAEKKYLEGKYAEALNTIIGGLQKEGN